MSKVVKIVNIAEDAVEESKDWPQIVTIFIACLCSISNGMQYAWTSPFIVKIANDKVNYNITVDEASHFTTIHPLATIIFSLFVPALNDILGRKYCVILIAAPQILFWILTALATNVYVFYAARVVSGLGDALHFSSLPMYLGEIATPNVRGKWANVVSFVLIGHFLINIIGQNFSVVQTSYICLSLPVIFIVLMFFMPESPYYCAMKHDEDTAKKSLRFLRGREDVDKEYLMINANMERQMSETGTWKDLLFNKTNRIALLAGIYLRGSQQFSGMSSVQSFTQFIFENSGSNISSGTSTLIISGLLCILTFFSGHVAERFGRKKSFISSMLACAIMLLLVSAHLFLEQNTSVNLDFMNWFPLVGMTLYIIVSSFGVTPIPTLMLGELFSNSIKTKGIGMLTVVLGIFLLVTNRIFYVLTSFGMFAPFFFFGVCCIISTIMGFFIIPETKGKTLEEIQQSLKKNKKKESDDC